MQLGVVVMPTDPLPVAVERAQELEALGCAHLWVYDHLSWRHYRDRPWHATMPWLAAMAAATTTIRLGTMVASPNLRHPLTLAKEAMTLDHVSDGRLLLGLGAGTAGPDATVFGDAPLTPGQRADRLAEYVDVLDRLLTGGAGDHRGPWYTVDGGRVLPGCVQRPRLPLAVAGGSRRTVALAAERADVWITLGHPTEPPADLDQHLATVTRLVEQLDDHCAAAGRDPASIERLHLVSSTNPAPMTDLETFTRLADQLDELGFDHLVVHDRRTDDPHLDHPEGLVEQLVAAYSTDG